MILMGMRFLSVDLADGASTGRGPRGGAHRYSLLAGVFLAADQVGEAAHPEAAGDDDDVGQQGSHQAASEPTTVPGALCRTQMPNSRSATSWSYMNCAPMLKLPMRSNVYFAFVSCAALHSTRATKFLPTSIASMRGLP